MPLISWNTVTLPKKKEGDLDIQRAKIKNESMPMILAWRFMQNPTNIWTRVLNDKYNSKGRAHPKPGSRTWRNLLQGWQACSEAST